MCRIIELLTEAAHRHVDHVALSLELSAPDAMEQLLPAEHPPRTPRECGQQVELTPAKVKRSVLPPGRRCSGSTHSAPALSWPPPRPVRLRTARTRADSSWKL